MLVRAAFRALVVQQLRLANTAAGLNVFENRALPLAIAMLPAITVSTPADHKQSMLRGGPQFTSTFGMEIGIRVSGLTDDQAVLALEQLLGQVEAATLSNQLVIDQVQQFATVRTEQQVSAEGTAILAEARLRIECEVYEDYRNPPFSPLTDIFGTVTGPSGAPGLVVFDAAPPQ